MKLTGGKNPHRKNALMSLIIFMVVAAIMASCSSRKSTIMTKKLFMQTKRANIELPYQKDSKDGGAAIVSERVTFRDANGKDLSYGEVAFKEGENKLDTSAVYRLKEVEVKAKSRFAPERDGRISVDFKIVVPKEIVSNDWRLLLNPELMHNDSIVPLQKVILNGQGFVDKQEQDYADYEEFLGSLIDKSAYDSVYLDKKSVNKDIRTRQNYYFDIYFKDWKKQVAYEKWKFNREDVNSYYSAREVGYKSNEYHKALRKIEEHTVRNLVEKKDTTGIYAKYMNAFEKKTKKYPDKWEKQELDLKEVPRKYRDIHESGRTISDVINHVVTEKDSMDIAKNRYFFDEIALNEVAIARKDDIFKELVKFPYEENKSMVRLDTIIPEGDDFAFVYTQEYPVTIGLKSVRITMGSRVQAVDRSEYVLPASDTLSFFISSLAQLMDTSLVTKRTELRRNLYDRITVYTAYRGGPKNSNYEISYEDNKVHMDKFLEAFQLYNDKPDFTIDSVTMVSTTSLDGDYDDNYELTLKRANSVKSYLSKTLAGEANVENLFNVVQKGEDWSTLVTQIRRRKDMPNKDEIVNMLTNAVYPDQCELDIKKQFPSDYKIIQDSIYPLLRRIEFIVDIHRTGLDNDTVKVEYREDYKEGLRLMQDREYWKAIDILANYPDYNTALCLVCMGYNEKAEDLLVKLPVTANTEYLHAIICTRTNRDEEAVQHLMEACTLDPSKVYRTTLDPELGKLIKKYGLQHKLDAVSYGDDDVTDMMGGDDFDYATEPSTQTEDVPTNTGDNSETE